MLYNYSAGGEAEKGEAPTVSVKSTSVYQVAMKVSGAQTILTTVQQFKITKSLHGLGNDELTDLGLALGLEYGNMKRMSPNKSFIREMLASWLNKEDNVMTASGEPSWNSLVKALEDIDQHGTAQKIRKGK